MTDTRIALRRDTTANWTLANPILRPGEPALDITAGTVRYGDGVAPWSDLPVFGGLDGTLGAMLADPTSTLSVLLEGAFAHLDGDGRLSIDGTPAGADTVGAEPAGLSQDTKNVQVAAISAATTRVRYGPRVVFDGDSITIASVQTGADGNQNRASSWCNVLTLASRGRIKQIYNAGVAGQESAGALARFDTYVAPYAPDTVILSIGANDIGHAITQAAFLANITAYYQKCVALGARLIIGEVWPTDETATLANRGQLSRDWSVAIGVWAAARGVKVIPWQKLADPITGGWPAGWSSDKIHPLNPTIAGTTIGQFGWEIIKPLFGEPVIPRPVLNGRGLLANGLMTTLSATISLPVVSGCVADTASGTLPAGQYAYRVAPRGLYGEGVATAPVTATLPAAGKITLTWNNSSGNRGFSVYRRGPLDTDYRRIWSSSVGGTITFVDDGSFVIGTATPVTSDASQFPLGMLPGTTIIHADGGGPRLVNGIRGNVWRFTPYETGAESSNYFATGAIAPGDVVEITGQVAGTSACRVMWYFRSDTANLGVTTVVQELLTPEFGTFYLRAVAPAGTTQARLYFLAPSGYLDAAELSVEKV